MNVFATKKRFILPMAVAVGFLILATAIFIINKSGSSTTNDSLTNNEPPPLKPSEVKIHQKLEFSQDGDANKDGLFNGGDTIKVSFELENTSQNGAKFMTLETGILKERLYYVRNITGPTGYDDSDGKIRFLNLVVLPKQTQSVSFEASLVHNSEDVGLNYEARLTDSNKNLIAKDENQEIRISKSPAGSIPSQVTVTEDTN